MRKIIAGAFLSLDGVMQGPGGPEEDTSGGFALGGWTVPFWDDAIAGAMGESFASPFDLLLGRKTYDIFAAHWPHVPTDPSAPGYDAGSVEISNVFNGVTKHVASRSKPDFAWQNSEWLGDDTVAAVRALKQGDGPDILTQGSSDLLQTLIAADLVDAFRLLIYPVVLGKGKRLFGDGAIPAGLKATKSLVSPSGVIVATYERDGDVRTGSFALDTPTDAEIERRRNID